MKYKKWALSEVLFFLYAYLFFYIFPLNMNNNSISTCFADYSTFKLIRDTVPVFVSLCISNLLIASILRMEKKEGIIFCVIHEVICIGLLLTFLYHIEFILQIPKLYFMILVSIFFTTAFILLFR